MPIGAAIPAIIGGGVALIGGKMQSDSAKKQAQAVQNASDQSAATQRYIFDTIRSDNRTRQQAGDAATRLMAQIMGLNLGPVAGQTGQTGQTPAVTGPQVLPGEGYPGNALRNGPFGSNVVANGLAAVARINGGGGLTSGQTGQTQTPANALNPQTPQATPAQPFNVTDWLRSTPGYQFNFDEGMRALNHGLASSGRLQSGDAGREAIRYGQNYGDRIYGDQFNRLAGIAGTGQTASNQTGAAGQNYANAMTNINANNANALASSYQNSANAWTNALGGLGGAAMWGLGRLS